MPTPGDRALPDKSIGRPKMLGGSISSMLFQGQMLHSRDRGAHPGLQERKQGALILLGPSGWGRGSGPSADLEQWSCLPAENQASLQGKHVSGSLRAWVLVPAELPRCPGTAGTPPNPAELPRAPTGGESPRAAGRGPSLCVAGQPPGSPLSADDRSAQG